MSIKRTRTLRDIYHDIAAYDLVLVPESALADAINRRVETPQFGTFATTPRRLASGRREQSEDRLAFLEVIERTDQPWKAIAYAIGNVLQCWEHHGTPKAIFDYGAYVDETTEQVVEIMAESRSTSSQLSEFTVDPDKSVAVVGLDQLTELERSVLPADYERVDLFTDEAFEQPPFHVFESTADIINALLETIDADTAEDVGVVLDSSSRYSSLVESALEAADIPYYGGPGFVDDPDHRAIIRLLRTAYRGSETTVGDVRPIAARAGNDIDVEHDGKRLDEVNLSEIRWIDHFCKNAATHTFADALDVYESAMDRSFDEFREELTKLGLETEPLSQGGVEDLAYYLQTYEVPIDRENEGVLLADAQSSGYVDRPAVFYLGMDEGWTHSAPQRPWVDAESQFDRYIRQFQLLLQSGTEQYYLVQDTAGGQPVTPCLYFGEIIEEDFERFSDLDSKRYVRPRADGDGGFETEPVEVDSRTQQTISQSGLNRYVNSPRDFFFKQLLDGPDRDYFREGNLFHDFAEFYVTHPELIGEDEIDEIVEVFVDEVQPFYHDAEEPLRRREYRIGLETIVEYLDEHPPDDHNILTGSSGRDENFIADFFDRPVDSPLTERWFEDAALGVKGKIDLVRAADHLVDHKSGRKRSEYAVVKGSSIDPPSDTPNFQAALYLSYFRTQQPETEIEFTFFHFTETMDDVIAGEARLEDAITSVTYYPTTFDEFVGSKAAYEHVIDGYNDCVETFEDLGYEAYHNIVSTRSFPETTDREELRESDFAAEFTAAVTAATGDVDAEKGADQAIRELNGVRKRAFFRDDLDSFEKFVENSLADINDYREGLDRFPIEGPGGEPNYRRVDHRDCLLEGREDD